ncbi:efflux transporter outer membrane subunit [Roseomonas sp. OT10]|uniref:efflux transporter outer membrane subunit n=1 Tax=Roseomonas cutis TaxID=2897332 RepID=UPI001E32A97B|nr:efflux transporter outer membrane subunit [Roseomonas sp. OT10]UFN47838.1 efflux transporter outer membrane subunit [Roseomonas sp. OT10]
MLALLAACGPKPAPALSGLTLPDRYRQGTGEAARWPDPQWWSGFGSPELDALMAAAMADNLDLAAAAARVRQADAQVRITGSALLPTVTLDSSATQRQVAGRGDRTSSAYAASLAASYEVDFWGRNRSLTQSAELSARATRYDAITLRLTTQASVANTLFEVLAAQAQLRVQEENLRAARRVLAVIRQQVGFGIATGLDLAQQETVVAQQEAALPSLRQTAQQGINALAVLTGRPPAALPAALEPQPDRFDRLRIPAAAPGQPADLLVRRPDVLAAEADLAGANANIAAARAALLPSIVLGVQGGVQSALLGTLLRPEAQVYSLVASLAQTIFDGGALRGRVALSEAQAEELVAAYRAAIVQALSDVEDALVATRETAAQEELRREAAARAERAYAIAEAQLQAGTITLITLLNVQQSLFSTRTALVQARLARLQAAVGLFRALGGGWQP